MELYPAVDIAGGRLARAGSHATGVDPVATATAFARAGARWLHVVDLDRAHGRGDNAGLIRALLTAPPTSIQLGGGITDEDEIAAALAAGASRVVLGAAGATDAALVDRLLARHGASRIAVAIDARDGRLAPRGQRAGKAAGALVNDVAARLVAQGVRTIVYTAAERDGDLSGPDLDGARAIATLGGPSGVSVIVSGGVASLDDLRAARRVGLAGAIVGRALLEGRFTIEEALACVA